MTTEKQDSQPDSRISRTEDPTLTRYAVMGPHTGASAQHVSRPWIWATDEKAAMDAVAWVMGRYYGITV